MVSWNVELRLNRIKWLKPIMLVQTIVHYPLGGCAVNVVDQGQHFKTYRNMIE